MLLSLAGIIVGLSGQSVDTLKPVESTLNGFLSIPYLSVAFGVLGFLSNILWLYIAFWPGTKGDNKYGSPLQFMTLRRTFATVFGLR